MIEATPGQLFVYRASRLEALLDPLRTLAEAAPPVHPLAAVEVVAGHAGMRPWLATALARKAGPGGIAANLDIRLPSAWLEALAQDVLGESAVALAPYTRAQLRWRVHALLPDCPQPRLQAYLQGVDRERRRLQLADHVAGLFSRYIVYRRDWLAAWARGESALPADAGSPLPWLWQRLRTGIGRPHRSERLQQLVDALPRHAAARGDVLHLFGLNHLAPAELAVFAAVARHRPVALYVADPCRLDWGDLGDQRRRLRQALEVGTDVEAAFLEQPHPLLAAWGRLGQEFLLALDAHEPWVDVRHWEDERDDAPATRLAVVQDSLRRMAPTLLATQGEAPLRDASLRVHACHTRLRELEVLRDALLAALAELDGLRPSQIAVVAPDIQAYLPLLPAVFGPPGEGSGPLPYHLADIAIARVHPLLQAFRRLLDLPTARITTADVVDLLRVPQVAARLRLDDAGVERIAGWLQQANVAWGLDGAQRARLGLPAVDAHGFAWGMDRLLAAHVFGESAEVVPMPGGGTVLPVATVEGPQAADLGGLDALLVQLADWQADAGRVRHASDWARMLDLRIDALFRVDAQDRAAQDALDLLRAQVRRLATEPAEAGLDPELDHAGVRDLLRQALDAVPERQPFLLGGVTICGMVPQRAIPFRVVAVLGLNDGEFPRTAHDAGLDLMATHRRSGDRELRHDDRYLFLETLMSARDRLHLSWIGEGVADGKPRNPAAPLAELLAELDRAHGIAAEAAEADARRPWLVRHPLQPFDGRYFDGQDPRLFTHRADFAAMQGRGDAAVAAFCALHPAPVAGDVPPPETPVPLAQVLGYYRNPAQQLLRDGLGLRLEAAGADTSNEPLDAAVDARERLPLRLLREAVQGGQPQLPADPPHWLRAAGLLPAGQLGLQAWSRLRHTVDGILANAHGLPLLEAGWPPPWRQPLAADVAGVRIVGTLPDAVQANAGAAILAAFPGKKHEQLDLGQRVCLFLQWALLRLHPALEGHDVKLSLLHADQASDDVQASSNQRWAAASGPAREAIRAELQGRVARLVGLFLAAQEQPLAYFPKTATAALADKSIASAWAGGFNHVGERDHAPGYARLLAGEDAFEASGDRAHLGDIAWELLCLARFDGDEP